MAYLDDDSNAATALLYLFAEPKQLPNSPIELNRTTMVLLCLLSVINLSFAVGLWYWKKWAFFGFTLTAVLMFFTNLNMGIDIASAALGLIGIVFLYLVLQIKHNGISGWDNLE